MLLETYDDMYEAHAGRVVENNELGISCADWIARQKQSEYMGI